MAGLRRGKSLLRSTTMPPTDHIRFAQYHTFLVAVMHSVHKRGLQVMRPLSAALWFCLTSSTHCHGFHYSLKHPSPAPPFSTCLVRLAPAWPCCFPSPGPSSPRLHSHAPHRAHSHILLACATRAVGYHYAHGVLPNAPPAWPATVLLCSERLLPERLPDQM